MSHAKAASVAPHNLREMTRARLIARIGKVVKIQLVIPAVNRPIVVRKAWIIDIKWVRRAHISQVFALFLFPQLGHVMTEPVTYRQLISISLSIGAETGVERK